LLLLRCGRTCTAANEEMLMMATLVASTRLVENRRVSSAVK